MNSAPLLESGFQFRDVLAIVRKRFWTLAAVFLIPVILVAIWNFKATPIYRATVQLLIEPVDPKIVNIEEVQGRALASYTDYYATQHQILRSPTLARRAAGSLRLAGREGYGLPSRDEDPFWIGLVTNAYASAVQRLRGLVEEKASERRTPPPGLSLTPEERAVGALLHRLEVEPVRRTRLVNVHFDDRDPALATQVANKLTELYLTMNLEMRLKATQDASGWLATEIARVRDNLARAEQALQAYKEKFNLVAAEDRQNIVVQKLAELNSEATKARTARIALEVLANQVRNGGDLNSLASLPDVMENPVIQRLKGEFVNLQNEHSALSKRYKGQHPQLLRLKSRLALVEKKIGEEIGGISRSIMTRYEVALAREKSLVNSLEEQKQETLRLNRMSIQYQALLREVETNRRLYDSMLQRTKETDLLEGLKTSNIHIVEKAQLPKSPVSPRKAQNILLAMAASLVLGLSIVTLLDHLDTRVRNPQEVEAIAGAPTIGVIADLGRKVGKKYGPLQASSPSESVLQECFREMRTMAAFRMGSGRKVIQLTSCVPREGKTLISANLALALSDAGRKVLLIDGDFQRAGLYEWFRIRREAGLFQVLAGEAEPAEVIWRGSSTSLSVMPSGRTKGASHRIFEASDLKRVIDSVKDGYDYVIVDSPPILVISDPLVWSQCMDGVFFVVDVQQVDSGMLRQAVEKLNDLKVPILGVILNRMTRHHRYYYYGYSKKYGYYYKGRSGEKAESA